MNGLSVGILSGLLVSGAVLAAVSLNTPLPPRPDVDMAAELDVTVSAEGAEAEMPVEDATPEVGSDDAQPEAPAAPVEEEVPATEAPAETVDEEGGAAEQEDAAEAEDDPQADGATQGDGSAPEADAAPDVAQGSDATAPATDIPLPSGSEFNRPPPEEEAALPAPDAAPNAAAPAGLQSGGVSQAPSFDTAPAAQPNVVADAPASIGSAPALGDAPSAPSGNTAVASVAGPATLSQPDASATPQVETSTAPLPVVDPPAAPEAEGEAVADTAPEVVEEAAPEIGAEAEESAPTEEIAALDAAEPEAPALQSPRFPTIGDRVAENIGGATDAPAASSTPQFPQISRLPQAGGLAEEAAEEADEPELAEPVDPANLRAIEAFATPFDVEDDRPLMAVVLIDEPDSRIDIDTLTRFTFPVAFAIDPLHPDATERAALYRGAGFEVVLLGSMLPEGATAVDTEVAVSAAQAVLPEAVALLDTPESRIQGDRPVLDATVALLAETGHGIIAFPRGLNAAEQTAARAGVPGATLFRLLDGENERATMITRVLSRAAFTAAQEGTVIVAGHTRPDTVTALFSWALGDRSEGVALAPLSATLLRASEP